MYNNILYNLINGYENGGETDPPIPTGAEVAVQDNTSAPIVDLWDIVQQDKKRDITTPEGALEWNRNWINSPMHKEMLTAELQASEENDSVEDYTRKRFENLEDIKITTHNERSSRGWHGSSDWTGAIDLYSNRGDLVGIHEVSHSSDRRPRVTDRERLIPSSSREKINEYRWNENLKGNLADKLPPDMLNNLEEAFSPEEILNIKKERKEGADYVTTPTETRARLNAIRAGAQRLGIYDPFTEKLSDSQMDQLIKNQKSLQDKQSNGPYYELNQIYTEEEIMDMLNTISYENSSDNELPQARYGGPIHKYKNGGVTDPSKPGSLGLTEEEIAAINDVNSRNVKPQVVNRLYPDISNIDTTKTAASESTGVAMPRDPFGDNMEEFVQYNTLDPDFVIPDRLKPRQKYDDSHWAYDMPLSMQVKNNMNSAATNILTLASELRLPTNEEKKARAQYVRDPYTGDWIEREGQTAKNLQFAINTIPNAAINLFGFSRNAAAQGITSTSKIANTVLSGVQGDLDTFEKGIEAILFKKGKGALLKNLANKPSLNKVQEVVKRVLAFDKNPTTKAAKNRAKAVNKLAENKTQTDREKTELIKKWERMRANSQKIKKRESLASFKEGGEVEGVEEQQELPLRTSSTTPVSQEYWDFINTREGYTPEKLKEIEGHEELYQAKQNFYKDAYNTPLSKDEQALYDIWYPKAVRDTIINPMDHGVYDIPGFWQSGQWKSKDGRGHGTDTFKKPNHITFSNESKWSSQQGGSPFEGGSWDETGGFKPGKDNFYDNGQIQYEFDRERKYWEEKGKKNMVPEHLMYGIPESITEMEEMPQDNTNVNLDLIPEESFNIE